MKPKIKTLILTCFLVLIVFILLSCAPQTPETEEPATETTEPTVEGTEVEIETETAEPETETANPESTEEVEEEPTTEKKLKDIDYTEVTDLSEPFTETKSVVCDLIDRDGNPAFLYSKDKKVRIETLVGDIEDINTIERMNIIYLGNEVFSWSEGYEDGIKYKINAETGEKRKLYFQKEFEGFEFVCENSQIADEAFVVPEDVSFEDVSELLE